MLTSPPPDLVGQALAQSALGALLALVAAGASAWALWALSCWMGYRRQRRLQANRLAARYGARYATVAMTEPSGLSGSSRRQALTQMTQMTPHTMMKPLELDLARIETLPVITAIIPSPTAFPRQTPPTPPAPPSARPPVSPSAGSLAGPLMQPAEEIMSAGGGAGRSAGDGTGDWPPAAASGATPYRYIFASGKLVRLRSLRLYTLYRLPRETWN